MQGYLSLVLHAHLPFVRHPEYERALEESWLYEAITEAYIPLLQLMEGWERDSLLARLTITLTPTLCSMLLDPLLQSRYLRHLNETLELLDREIHRTRWEKALNDLALFYHRRLLGIRDAYVACGGNLVGEFRRRQELGQLEIITSAATHALLPLLEQYPSSLRAQVMMARDHYISCFGRGPRGIWLPECGYSEGLEKWLAEANLQWFIVDTHGILLARPRARYAMFAPVLTPSGVAAFGRDLDSARQVWSRAEGYPGDPRYRDFYRDIGFDLDYDYVKPHLPAEGRRGFTGIKYYRITGSSAHKEVYDRGNALQAAEGHASHFFEARSNQIREVAQVMDRPPLVLCPYDAELFGHWWYEGPEFLDYFVRKACSAGSIFKLITPGDYLRLHPVNQVSTPSTSSWGEGGYFGVWLNPGNEWIYRELSVAQQRMAELVQRFDKRDAINKRALMQAGRELLLAQASDWPFILRTGTSPDYARKRVKEHLARFSTLYEQIIHSQVDLAWLTAIEHQDNVFPEINCAYWGKGTDKS